jgi:hypothetical protein
MSLSPPVDDQPRVDCIEVRHLSADVAERVHDWFNGKIADKELDGDRSVHIAHPHRNDLALKIKGAGFRGGRIQFGKLHRSGPKAPVFDFEGRMMEDVAAGHDNAYRGAASFQQAVTEHRAAKILTELGYPVVPCLGYGRVEQGGISAWFAVFEWNRAWNANLIVPHIAIEEWVDYNRRIGQLITELAVVHDLIGHCGYVAEPDGSYVIKDLHPFRQTDPINMSQISWVMQVFFCLHIRCYAALNLPKWGSIEDIPEDMQAMPLKAVCPSATKADHDSLRLAVVPRYMFGPPADFRFDDLVALLRSNPISRALLDICPDKYTRY